MTITVHHPPGGGGASRSGGTNETSISTVTITQVRKNSRTDTTSTTPSKSQWEYDSDDQASIIGGDRDNYHFPSRISEEMLAADIRETTINCDDDDDEKEGEEEEKRKNDDDRSKRESARDSLIESVNEQLESIEEMLFVQNKSRRRSNDVNKAYEEDNGKDGRQRGYENHEDVDNSDAVSTREAGTTPLPESPSDVHHLTENDTVILPTIIPRSLSDDNLYYPVMTENQGGRGGGGGGGKYDADEFERDLARFDLNIVGSSEDEDEIYERESTPPFPLHLHLGDEVDYDGRGNVNELSR